MLGDVVKSQSVALCVSGGFEPANVWFEHEPRTKHVQRLWLHWKQSSKPFYE